MRKLVLLSTFILGGWMYAQAQVNVNINIGSPPAWGLAGNNHANYYYLPDIETYYYIPKRQFIYREGNKWVYRNSVAPKYRNYDLHRGYKVAIKRERAYKHFNNDRKIYAKYKNFRGNQYSFKSTKKEKYYSPKKDKKHYKNTPKKGKRHY